MKKNVITLLLIIYTAASIFSLDIPKWFLKPPKDNKKIYAVGHGQKKSPQMAMIAAQDNARSEISKVLRVKLTSVTEQFLQSAKVNDEEQITEFTRMASSSISSNTLHFSKIEKQEIMNADGKVNVFVLVSVDLAQMQKSVDESLKDLQGEYDKLNAKKDLDALADELMSSIPKKFKKTTIVMDKEEINRKVTGDTKSVSVESGSMPDWVKNYPVSSQYFIGIGQGPSPDQAKNSAVSTLVSQIKANVQAEIQDFMKETNGVTEEEISQNIQISVKEDVEDLEIVGLWKASDSEYWAYYRLDIETYMIKQQQKIESAKANGLDFLTKSDNETDPSSKFKYAFMGYYLTAKYMSKDMNVEYNNNRIMLTNELAARIQQFLSGITITTETPEIELDIFNTKPQTVTYKVTYGGKPLVNFPVIFAVTRGDLDITQNGVTDSTGQIKCVVAKPLTKGKLQSFKIDLDIKSIIENTAESTEAAEVFYNRLAKLGIPSLETLVKVNPPIFYFDLAIYNDLMLNPKYENFVKSMSANFKKDLIKKTGAKFSDDDMEKLRMEMEADASINISDRSGNYFTRLLITITIFDNLEDEELFSISTPGRGVKGGSATEEKSVRAAVDKFLEEFKDDMIEGIGNFMLGN